MRRIAILGFGREGRALLKYLSAQTDLRREIPRSKVTTLDRKFDPDYLKNLDKFDLVYRSPGVPYNLPEIRAARREGVKFSSATALFFERAKGKVIGVTGTKGKGTTSTLIYKILKAAGKDAYLAGNIGKPATNILPKLKRNSITVLELSSFQLQDLKRSPQIAVVLDLFPDHMDAHRDLKEYFEAKSSIARYQTKKDKVFYVASNKYAKATAAKSKGTKVAVNSKAFKLFSPQDLEIRGEHNFKNAVMAATVTASLGINKKIIIKTVKNYRGLPHRLQYLTAVKGVKIYNDSASTNPTTTAAAIRAFPEPKIALMGGRDKNLSYAPVRLALAESNTKLVVLYGECREKIRKVIKGIVPIKMVGGNLEAALKTALKAAKPNSVIVFSPGAASFDMFRDYKDRGEHFTKIARKLTRGYTSRSS